MRRREAILGGLVLTAATRARAGGGPVVLELFTSQGCSSCPPADALLGELAAQPGVIALAWHVDYWNHLGWRDPYASRACTERQAGYARTLREEVYTPALVVNGAAMMVGSDRGAVRTAIAAAGMLPLRVGLSRSVGGLRLTTDAWPAGVTGLLVTYDPVQATKVRAGENARRQLRDHRVVRGVRTVTPDQRILGDVGSAQGAAVLLQDGSGRIVGAADSPAVS